MRPLSCLIVDDEPTARDILQLHCSQIPGLQVIGQCKNAQEAIAALQGHMVDVVLLDINMPDMSGISLAKSLGKSTKVIFTTAYREYAIDGFEVQAVDYLLKPISKERLVQAIDKLRAETYPETVNREFMVVRVDRKMLKVDFADIRYIEGLGDYLKVHLHSKTVVTRETLAALEEKLPPTAFIRIHRSFIVAVQEIRAYTSEYVEVVGQTLPISRSHRQAFLQRMDGSGAVG